MRNLILATTLLGTACTSSPAPLPDPPVLKVTSPARSLIQDHAGSITVTGTVAPNPAGVPVSQVMVNGVPATVGADGSFTANVQVKAGATLLHTEATDQAGGKATDTRSVEAGELRAPGSNIDNAITAAISANAFIKISDAAATMLKATDLMPMLAPMNPMVHVGDSNGPDCLYAQLYVDNFKMSDAKLSLVPVVGGLSFSAEIDGLDVPGHMNYAVACIDGSNTTSVTADKVVISGTLNVAPDGMNGFTTTLTNQNVQLSGLNITASGVPGTILSMLPIDSAIEYIAPKAAEMFMGPMMNKALGALGGPQKLNVLGKTIDVQVSPSDVQFDTTGGVVTLNMMMLIEGTENSKGYIFTDNGMPTMNPGMGMQMGIADDLANEMLSELVATGLLSLVMPENGGAFDSTKLDATSPPMISADPADGKMRLVLPDMMMTFMLQGTPVAKAALNASVDLKIVPVNNGYGVAIQLGAPTINVDVLDDIPNATRVSDDDLGKAVQLGMDSQIASISALLGGIPLPAIAGLQMKDLSVGSADGYVMIAGTLQ